MMNNRRPQQHFEYGTLPSTSMDDDDSEHQAQNRPLPVVLDRRSATSGSHSSVQQQQQQQHHQRSIETVLNVTMNILEWYAFAVFGYLSDVFGTVFFAGDDGSSSSLLQSFAVFGGAFFVRPLGGMVFGYLGDVHGRHIALIQSVYLMGLVTMAMAALPTGGGYYSRWALVMLRLLQGLSAGGQLMSSLVFGVESRPRHQWGWYGSFVVTAANLGNLLSGASVYVLRLYLEPYQVETWGWRLIHWVSGILLVLCAWLLQVYTPKTNKSDTPSTASLVQQEPAVASLVAPIVENTEESSLAATSTAAPTAPPTNPLRLAFAATNRRALLAACMVPVLGSAGFWWAFVWMAVYMYTLSPHPIPSAFGLNACAMLGSIIFFFPIAGHWSDLWGRRRVMTVGGVAFGFGSPVGLWMISQGSPGWALIAQLSMGIALSLWCAPMAAWLAESFEPHIRLTSAAVGYNLGVGIFSGITPAAATYFVQRWGYHATGYLVGLVCLIGLVGLWIVAPKAPPVSKPAWHHHHLSSSIRDPATAEEPGRGTT